MSTYTNSESVINVATINVSSSSSSGTVYTCPSGRYAKITLNSLSKSTGGTVKILSNGVDGFTATPASSFGAGILFEDAGDNISLIGGSQLVLNSGQSLTWSISGGGILKISGTAIEFVKP